MISERQAKEREFRKEQILEGALTVFKSKGVEGATGSVKEGAGAVGDKIKGLFGK